MPAYCDICGRSGSVFWSNYENWWNPKIYCSFTCSAVGSWGVNLVLGTLFLFGLFFGGIIAFFGFIFGVLFLMTSFYGYKHAHLAKRGNKNRPGNMKEAFRNYEKMEKNFDETENKVYRDM